MTVWNTLSNRRATRRPEPGGWGTGGVRPDGSETVGAGADLVITDKARGKREAVRRPAASPLVNSNL